jgi:site-specific recombinase XerD
MLDIVKQFEKELHRQGKSPHTVRAYIGRVGDFLQWLEERYAETDPTAITVLDVREYQTYCIHIKKYAPAGIQQRLSAIRVYCDFLVAQGRLGKNPADEVQPIRVAKQETAPEVLSNQDLQKLRREVYKGENKRDIAIFDTLLYTGVRVNELIHLTLDDIEISERKGTLIVRSGKGNKYREVPLAIEARKAISDYLEVRPAGKSKQLFLGQRGSLRTTDAVWKLLKKYASRVGLEQRVHPHLLRHQFATELVRRKKNGQPADLSTAAALLGHKNINTTMVYTKPTPEEMAQAVEGLF